MAFGKMPIHCQPDKMSMWDKVLTIFSSKYPFYFKSKQKKKRQFRVIRNETNLTL